MRNFINIINGNSNVSPLSTLVALEEGIKLNLNMLSSLKNIGERYKLNTALQYFTSIEDVMRRLQRNDRQIYAARWCRLWAFKKLFEMDKNTFWKNTEISFLDSDVHKDERNDVFEKFHEEVTRLTAKYTADWQKTMGVPEDHANQFPDATPMATIRREIFNHFMGIEYSKIQNYVWGNKPFKEIVHDLNELEEEYKAKISGMLTMSEGDEIILKLDNGFCWMMLDRGYCRNEADAMGHCGNVGARPGDRILSLRKFEDEIDGQQFYSVYLTFILQKDGKLGEMKGRANEKPAERYHGAIIALLKLPIIKGIRGGGYAPGNNFSLSDLTDEQRDALLDQKPELGGLHFQFQKFGNTPELRETLLSAINEHVAYVKPEMNEERIVLHKWEGVAKMVSDLTEDDFTRDMANGDSYQYFEHDMSWIGESEVENLFDELSLQRQIRIAQYVQGLVEENEDEDDIENFDQTQTSEVIEKLKEYDEDTYDQFRNAVASGNEAGAEGEAYTALLDAIDTAQKTIKNATLYIPTRTNENGKTYYLWDDPCYIQLSIEDACKLVDRMSEEEDEYDPEIDLDDAGSFWDDEDKNNDAGPIVITQPYNGFSDYDSDAAKERLLDDLDIPGIDEIEKAPGEKPDFASMPNDEVEAWINNMYEKIPDGYIRKNPLNTINQDRWPGIADGLWRNYYG